MTIEKNILAGETCEWVLIDSPSLDWHIRQQANSFVRLVIANFHSAAHQIHIDHLGTQCSTEVYVLAYLHGEDAVTLQTHMHHNVGDGKSVQLVKLVLDDSSKGTFVGELQILPDAQHVVAQQTNRNLLLSTQSEVRTQPQLEIYADDVQASHGASTGQLDETALFYMRQRGISPEQGRKMLLRAFVDDIVEKVSDSNLRQQLECSIDSILQ